ncbi:replication-relaxation family protein [Streptomyces mangrovisoli]|uniref:Replication-relaxation n=1 Tax=Streptomyces mangrovisoli TaxID=1428628 RepID=A0A1J4NLM7_9ACTN|nr:replication-relaxation family protein [Streptomyces mangrovisoli]OIJ63168.1 hypothetical protein WN71_035575 [Streptomyces mangrovisoli]
MPTPSDEPTPTTATALPEPLAHQVLTALAQHRMATTSQLHQMLRPEAGRRRISAPLSTLRRTGLVDYTVLPRSNGIRAWYLTGEGARLTRDLPALRGRPPYPITSASAASLKTPHTLTVVQTHLAFAADARRHGHEHGPLDWTPEVTHPIGDSQRLIADAVMHYTTGHNQHRHKYRAFIEVDRATMSSERLALKLIDYARLFHHHTPTAGRRRQAAATPGWQRWYPVFPRVLFVLTGASRTTLDHRISDLQAMTAQHPHAADLARHTPLAAAVLEDLQHQGPTADVWTPLTGGQRRPWTEL